jgi:hypothetical protein
MRLLTSDGELVPVHIRRGPGGMSSSTAPYSGSPRPKIPPSVPLRSGRAPNRFTFRLLFVGRRIRFRSRRGRGGLNRGWGTSKLWRARTISGPYFGTLDYSHQLAAHWGRRLYLFQRLAALRRGLGQGISRKANDSGKHQENYPPQPKAADGCWMSHFSVLRGLCTPMFRQFAVPLTCPRFAWAE